MAGREDHVDGVYGAIGGGLNLNEDKPTKKNVEETRTKLADIIVERLRPRKSYDMHSEISQNEKVERWRTRNFGLYGDDEDVGLKASGRRSPSNRSLTSSRSSHASRYSERTRALTKEIELNTKAAILKKRYEADERKRELQRRLEEEEYKQQQMQIEMELETARAIGKIYELADSDSEKDLASVADGSIAQGAITRAREIQLAEPDSSEQPALVLEQKRNLVKAPSEEQVKDTQQETVETSPRLELVENSFQQEQLKRPPLTQKQNGKGHNIMDPIRKQQSQQEQTEYMVAQYMVDMVHQRPTQDQNHSMLNMVNQRPTQDQNHSMLNMVNQRPQQDQNHSMLNMVNQRPPQDQNHNMLNPVHQRPPQDQNHSMLNPVNQSPTQDQNHSMLNMVNQRPPQDQNHSMLNMVHQRPPQDQTRSMLDPVHQRPPQDHTHSMLNMVHQRPPQDQTRSMLDPVHERPPQDRTHSMLNPVQQRLPQYYPSQNVSSGDYIDQGIGRSIGTMNQNPWLSPTPQVSAKFNFEMLNTDSVENDSVVEDVGRRDRENLPATTLDQTGLIIKTLANLLQEQQKIATLPKIEMQKYDGNPLQYNAWKQSFKFTIEEKTQDQMNRLTFLEKATTGEPNRIVRGMLNRGPTAYAEAMAQIERKFGNRYKISEAFKLKAEQWPEVKRDDGAAWSGFSIFIDQYWNTMQDLKFTSEVDHSTMIRRLLEKLPYAVVNQWRALVDKLESQEGKIAGFQEFVNFIERQARIVNNPLYGSINKPTSTKNNQQARTNRNRRLNFSTNATEESGTGEKDQSRESPSRWCHGCDNKSHDTQDCRKLMKKPYEDRFATIKKKGLCFACLKKGTHMAKDCKKRLKCKRCQRSHPTILHRDKKPEEKQEQPVEASTTCGLTGAGGGSSAMSVVPVVVKSKQSGKCVATLALLDSKSTAVFCSESLSHKLDIKGVKTRLRIQTINGVEVVNTCKLKDLEVADCYNNNQIELPDVYVQDNMPVSEEDIVTKKDIQPWAYLDEVNVPEIGSQKVELLIGNNVPQALEPIRVIRSHGNGPFACQTALGWEVHGVLKEVRNPKESAHRICVQSCDLNEKMTQMFNHDFSERSKDDLPAPSIEDQRFLNIVEASTQLVDGHYQIALPLRDRSKLFVNNKAQALQRVEHLKRKMKKNSKFQEDYKTCMKTTIDKGYAERVPNAELNIEDGHQWYIPHHGVYHPTKGKLRVVYDCAVHYKGCCLNEEVFQGPDLTNSLVGVLLRFRQEPVGLMADVEAMFSQVKLPIEDRNYLRFLWWPDGDLNQQLEEYRMTVHPFGATSSPSCANYALKKVAETCKEEKVAKAIERNFYVDDCLCSVPTDAEAIKLAEDLQVACKCGGFHLTKWVCNSRAVLKSIPKEERSKEAKELNLADSLPTERGLGLKWQVEADTLGFTMTIKDQPATRRGILSIVSSVYDPLGLVSPAVLPAKRIIQDLCRLNLSWDDEIPHEYKKRWNQWLTELPSLASFSVNRCFKPAEFGKPTSVQLHHFSDASEYGYGVVTYVRLQNVNRETHCSLVMSKSRVAPMKQVSIPRLELTAATVAVRLHNKILREIELPVDSVYFWTDSTTVLSYIRSETGRFQTFVANRVAIIRDSTDVSQWMYVNTELNPADLCSRGQSVEKFVDNVSWVDGPEFLKQPETDWPAQDIHIQMEASDPEVKKKVTVCAMQADEDIGYEVLAQLFRCYSDYHRLKRAVAWLLRVKKWLIKKIQKKRDEHQGQPDEVMTNKYLTVSEIYEAEQAILKVEQHKHFAKEIQSLCRGNAKEHQDGENDKKAVPAIQKASSIYRLDPKLEDGLLRVGGKLRRASSLTEEARHPVILPRNSHVSELILRQSHESTGHCGRNHMLSHLHQRYWIIGANSAARKITNRCITCRKQRGKLQAQKMADLPEDRLQPEEPPFTRVGMDFFCPMLVKQGRSMVKRYGVIFTCLAIRAVHIETANSLDTDSCIAAIRRFVARRGQVRVIRSDNGTNIVGSQRELKKEISHWNQQKISDALLQKDIEWKFNPPGASHFGGIWERQIRTIRKLMVTLPREQTLSDESLRTLLCEIEAVINSRPLTIVPGDALDLEPLTPNHLLQLKTQQNLPPVVPEHTGLCVRKRWKQIQYLTDMFWRRWIKEYLPQLQSRQKWVLPQKNVKVGDVVLVANESAPRNTWLTGRVMEIFPDNQGHVRQVKLKTKSSMLTRPVHKLCLLLEADGPQHANEPVKSSPSTQRTDFQDRNVPACQTKDDAPILGKRKIKPRKILDL